MHLLISHASAPGPACQQALAGLQLPHLQALLALLRPAWSLSADAHRRTPACELAHARALGLPLVDGLVPWAARAAQAAGLPPAPAYALLTPCHWDVHTQSVFMADPDALALTEAEARAVFAAMRPYFEEDGLQLHWLRPDTWLVAGDVLRDLPTASLERVRNAPVDDWIPRQDEARLLRRLHNEMQMLLYTHPVNLAREARHAPTVNAFWLSGTGSLAPGGQEPADVTVERSLQAPALQDHASAWVAAWQTLDAGPVRAALHAAQAGTPVQLTLASAAQARSLHTAPLSLWERLRRRLAPPTATALLQSL